MWLNRSLSIREVVWLLEELGRNHAYRSLVSSNSGPAVEMVKKWTRENYVPPKNRDMLPWVEEKIEGVPSRYHDDDQVSSLGVDVGSSCDWVLHPIAGDDRLCSPFDRDCLVPMYRCLFDVIGLRFPLSPFEVGVLNHLRICPSQLHPLSWALVRAFAFWCEWAGSEPSVPLFFSFFGVLRTSSDSSKNQGFVSFQQKPKMWT
ncbi:hypothetical protein A2U01_0007718 [Trifolium medium]|uniref:Transposase (putative) gypsy type domain-containing protein n=1 Tax=Trifolium medium TaxID=97028 RepID=A0A392MJF9_9FABA|nr:hypothetical protein [Trifolium medium]